MVVFSDLDRSIIYSKKFLKEDDQLDIEIYKGENISYISKDTVELIKKIKNDSHFIPATTRTIEQIKRINFKKYGLDFKYVITSNGGNILIDGMIDREYKILIDEKLKSSSPISEVVNLFEGYKSIEGILKFRVVEDLFFYIVIDEDIFDLKNIEEAHDEEDTTAASSEGESNTHKLDNTQDSNDPAESKRLSDALKEKEELERKN